MKKVIFLPFFLWEGVVMNFIIRTFMMMIMGAAVGVGIFFLILMLFNPWFWLAFTIAFILSLIFK